MNNSKKQWKYLQFRPQSWRQQLYVKGQKIKASDIYSEKIANNESLDEAAENWGLPKDVIKEAIEYCQLNKDLLKQEAKQEHLILQKNKQIRREVKNKTYKIITFISILSFIFVLILLRDILQIIIIGFSIIIFLRFVYKIPFIGSIWKYLFGEKTLWDWLELLLIPVGLLIIGIYFTNYFTSQQMDVNVEKVRYEVTQNYLDIFKKENFLTEFKQEVDYAVKNQSELKKAIEQNPENVCFHYYKYLPKNNLLTSKTKLVLEQLTKLKTSKYSKSIEKKHILEFLRSSELIKKGQNQETQKYNYLMIPFADMSSSDLYYADLSNTCLDSVKFSSYDGSYTSTSDMRRIKLNGSILTGAILKGANLRYADLRGAELKNSSLENADLRGANLSGAKVYNTKALKGAIYNTTPIPVPQRKESWAYNFICSSLNNYLKIPGYCLDPIDYTELDATTLPSLCKNEDSCNKLTQAEIEQSEMKENNQFPSLNY